MLSCSLITGWRDWPKVLHPYNINPMTVASRIISRVHLNRKNYSHIHPQLPSLQLKEFKLNAANISISQDPPVTGVISWSRQDGMLCCGPYKPMNYLFGLQVFYFAQLMCVPGGVCISSTAVFSLFCSPWWVIWDRCVRNCQDSFLTDHGSLLSQARVSWKVACLQADSAPPPIPRMSDS